MAEQTKIARRSFFAGLGLIATAGIAAKLTSQTTITPVAEPASAEPQGDGYRLTEHIKKYYRTTII
jgi:hypothetical protein